MPGSNREAAINLHRRLGSFPATIILANRAAPHIVRTAQSDGNAS
jgi:hypothetical protein